MSDFTSEGHDPYPNFHLDREKLLGATDLPIEYLEAQVGFYTRYLGRTGIMESHRRRANANLDRYIFELACRDGVYDEVTNKLEDETCDAL